METPTLENRIKELETRANRLGNWLKAAVIAGAILGAFGVKLQFNLSEAKTAGRNATTAATEATGKANIASNKADKAIADVANETKDLEKAGKEWIKNMESTYKEAVKSIETLVYNKSQDLSKQASQNVKAIEASLSSSLTGIERLGDQYTASLKMLEKEIEGRVSASIDSKSATALEAIITDLQTREFILGCLRNKGGEHFLDMNNGDFANGILTGAAVKATSFTLYFK